jgi:hypothetical protein
MASDKNVASKKNEGAEKKIKIFVVVNGEPIKINAIASALLLSILEPVLKKAGVNEGADLDRWTFKDDVGNVLDKGASISDLGLVDDSVIFLSLEAGGAG